ncbi:MAG: hypothetical protein KOO61_05400 [Spirochaetales bacterium]|nr:hypothetical protein [Spirochaetales bacterium]
MAAIIVSLDLQFRDAEHLRAEYHSFANLMNVVHAELQLLERMSGPDAGLRPNIRLCEAAAWSFKDPEAAAEHGLALAEFKSRVQADLARVQATPEYEQDAKEARGIIRQVIGDADLRVQETLARHGIHRPTRVCDGNAVRDMILDGAESALHRGHEPDGVATDRLQIDADGEVRMPHGLPEAVGRLAAELLRVSGAVGIDVSAAESATAIAVRTEPLEMDLVPTLPPSSIDSATPSGTARALIALISYLAGPEGEVTVDAGGAPLLLVRCG